MKLQSKFAVLLFGLLYQISAWSQADNQVSNAAVLGQTPVQIQNLRVSPDPVVNMSILTIDFDIEAMGIAQQTRLGGVNLEINGTFANLTGNLAPATQVIGDWTCSALTQGAFSCTSSSLTMPGTITPITLTADIFEFSTLPSMDTLMVDCGEVGGPPCIPSTPVNFQIIEPVPILNTSANGPTTVTEGEDFTYSVQVQNNSSITTRGPSVGATGVNINFQVSSSNIPTLVSAGGTNWFCNSSGTRGGAMIDQCSFLGDLAAGAITDSLIFTLTAPMAPDLLTSNFIVGADNLDPTSTSAEIMTQVVGQTVDLVLEKEALQTNVFVGDPVAYGFTISNLGPGILTGFTINDDIPAILSYSDFNSPGSDIDCVEASGTVTCNYVGSGITPGTNTVFTILTDAIATGNADNFAAAILTGGVIDPVTGNNSDNAQTVIVSPQPEADLAIEKTASVATIEVDNPFTYTLSVTNLGPSTANFFSIEDLVPSELSVDSINSDPRLDCNTPPPNRVGGNQITCIFSSTGKKGLGLPPGQSVSLDIDVTALQVGTVTNTADVIPPQQGVPDPNPANNSSSVDVTITPPPPPMFSFDLTASPDPVMPDTDQLFEFDFNNMDTRDIEGVGVELQFPEEYQLDLPTPQGRAAAGGGWNCESQGNNFVFCFNNLIPANSNSSFEIPAVSPTQEDTYQVSIVIEDESGLINETTTRSFVVSNDRDFVDLRLQKSSPNTVDLDTEFNYVLEVTNLGSLPATNIRITDPLPAEVSYQSFTGSDWTCDNTQGQVVCEFTPGTLAAGASTQVELTVLNGGETGQVTNTASVLGGEVDINLANNSGSATFFSVEPVAANLSLNKTALQAQVEPGGQIDFALNVTNTGNSNASGIRLTDDLPAGSSFAGFSGSGWMCLDQSPRIECDYGPTLLEGASANELRISLNAPNTSGTSVNMASVTLNEEDADESDNQASASFVVTGSGGGGIQADLSVSKTASVAEASAGDPVSYEITVLNAGPNAASNVSLMDNLPSQFSLDEITASGWSCQVTQSNVSCDLMNDLGSNETATVNLTGVINTISSDVINTVQVLSTTADPVQSNNTAQAVIRPRTQGAPADLNLEISGGNRPVLTDSSFNYIIRVFNEGPAFAEDVRLIGTLTEGVEILAITAEQGNCDFSTSPSFFCQFPRINNQQTLLVNLEVRAPTEVQTVSATFTVGSSAIDNDPSDDAAQVDTAVRETPEEEDLRERIEGRLGGSSSPGVRDNIAPVARLCDSPPPALIPWCRGLSEAIDNEEDNDAASFIEGIIGRQGLTQHTSLIEAGQALGQNVTSRLSQVRGGAGSGLNLSGLNLSYDNQAISMGLLQSALDDETATGNSSDLVTPWGFFVNGTISAGDRDPGTQEVSFDFDTYGLTAGFDYRFSNKSVAGIALGYSKFDSDFSDGSVLDSDGWDLTLFGSFTPFESFYLDGRLGYGSIDFDQDRVIQLQLRDLSIDDVARGSTSADLFSGALALGYNWSKNGWNINPSFSLSFLDGEIDAFNETGSIFSLEYDDQDVESFTQTLAFSVSRPFSLKKGVLSPQFDLSYIHESSNDDNDLVTRIVGTGASFLVENDAPDTEYGSAGLGLVFVSSNGKQAYLSYRQILGLSGFSRWTINAGFRFEF